MIVEDEQQGASRAEYGKQVLEELARKLTDEFGKGFSVVNLRQMRSFYLAYAIQQKSSAEFKFVLSWSHYLKLMRISNLDERRFYEIESEANHTTSAFSASRYATRPIVCPLLCLFHCPM